MDDHEIISQIGCTRRRGEAARGAACGRGDLAARTRRLRSIEVTLDQLWDLLRQRRALRDAGRSPDDATLRPEGTVEGYRQ